LYVFGPFHVDPASRLLLRNGETVPLTPKAFDTLLVLVENSGQILEKEDLMKRVWPDTAVEDNNLNQCISTLRKALGDSPNRHEYIATIPGRGFRFVGGIRLVTAQEGLPPPGYRWSLRKKVSASAAAGAVVIGVICLWIWNGPGPAGTGLAVRSIAVLPFKSLATAGDAEYLGLGLADALITRLSNVRGTIVRPTSSVVRYTDPAQDPIAAGRQLKVDSVLEGTIQRSGDRVRLAVRLLLVKDGAPLWADRFDERFTDIFAVQDSISERVTRALALKLSGDERHRVTKRYTGNAEAYRAYLKGRYYWSRSTREGLEIAIEAFQQAIQIDPKYALAYAGLADCYVFGSGRALPLRERVPKARAAIQRALEIDPSLAEAYAPQAYVKLSYDWDWAGAERDFQRAIELNPGYATAHHWYAECLAFMGRFEMAIAAIETARQMDPFSPAINTSLVRILYFARQYERAMGEAHHSVEMHPNFDQAHLLLGQVYEQRGMFQEAISEFQKAMDLSEGSPGSIASLGHAYAASGRRRDALKVLQDIQDLAKRREVSPFWLAMVYVGVGNQNLALDCLEKAYQSREGALRNIKVDPRLDSLRLNPRFEDLLRRVGLAP
jgi:DNA-binding winged helix-turn-helix (wHTH) protein/TolB-like protein/cytochrome c-type biogenesis protein CcmH/NrfG